MIHTLNELKEAIPCKLRKNMGAIFQSDKRQDWGECNLYGGTIEKCKYSIRYLI